MFPAEDFLIIHIEDIKANAKEVMHRIESFLGLPHFDFDHILEESRNRNNILPSDIPSEYGTYLAQYFESTMKNTMELTGIALPIASTEKVLMKPKEGKNVPNERQKHPDSQKDEKARSIPRKGLSGSGNKKRRY